MSVVPSNAHKFIDDRHSEDRRVRRTSWFGSQVHTIATKSGQSCDDENIAPKKDDVLRALNASPGTNDLDEMAKKFFAMLDALVLNRFKKLQAKQDQMIAGSASVILAPDYVIHCSGDNRNKQNYVSVLVGNKVLNIRDENNFEVIDKRDKTQIFISLDDKSEEAKKIRSKMITLDSLVAVEKLEGERLRRELPELNTVVKSIAESYGGSVDIIESEIMYFTASREVLDTFRVLENSSAAPDQVASIAINLDSLADLISKSKLQNGRVRLNLNSNSELETVDVLCEAVDTESQMKNPEDCLIILMNDYQN